jgi:hypothetical protein
MSVTSLRKYVSFLDKETIVRIFSVRKEHAYAAVIDDYIDTACSRWVEDNNLPLTDDIVSGMESMLFTRTLELVDELNPGDIVPCRKEFWESPEEDSALFPAIVRRNADIDVPQMHLDAEKAIAETAFVISATKVKGLLQHRKSFPREKKKGEKGMTQEGLLSGVLVRAISRKGEIKEFLIDKELYCKIGNFDYRFRKYSWKNLCITGSPRVRCLIDCPSYAWTAEVKRCMEYYVLRKQYALSPEEATKIGNTDFSQWLASGGGEAVYNAAHAYVNAERTGLCTYWAEFDAIASGIVLALLQLNDKKGVSIFDSYHEEHRHAREWLADKVLEEVPYLADKTELPGFTKLLKAVLAPLQYGAGKEGVFFRLTGVKYHEDDDYTEEDFAEVDAFIRESVFPGLDADELTGELLRLSRQLANAYRRAFPQLKAAEKRVSDYVEKCLKAGKVPTYKAFSGATMRGPVVKRVEGTHLVAGAHPDGAPRTCYAANKKYKPEDIASYGFSWVIHNIDAEVISLFVVRCKEEGIPCFTNHDAVFIPVWAWFQAQRIFAECVDTVSRHKILLDQFNCEPRGKRHRSVIDSLIPLV